MRRLFIVLALQLVCLVTSAQKVYYDGGYFEKDGSTWYEYKPQERSGVWNKFTEKTTDDNWYVIDNGLCQVAVPKSMNLDFLIRFPGETDWKFKYKHIAAPGERIVFSGRVVDMTGSPLAGALITQKGTGAQAISDINGKFTIAVEPSVKLDVSYIGYKDLSVAVKENIVIVMENDNTSGGNKYIAHLPKLDWLLVAFRPFNYFKCNSEIDIETAEAVLKASGYYSSVDRSLNDNNQLIVYEKDFVPYEDFRMHARTKMVVDFHKNRVKQSTYFFTYENMSKAKSAASHLKKKFSKYCNLKSDDQYSFKFFSDKIDTYINVSVIDNLGRGVMAVDVRYNVY